MTTLQIRCFVSLADTKKLTETASFFNLQVSTLSKYMDRIESEFCVKLFQKGRNGLDLTKEGALIYPSMKFIAKEYDDLILHMNKITNMDRSTMNIAMAFHQTEILAQLIDFSQIYPDINLTIQETPSSALRALLDSKSIDIAIAYEELLMKKSSNTVPIRQDMLVAVVGRNHPLVSRKGISIRELKDDTFFLFKGDTLFYRYQVHACIASGFTPIESPHDFKIGTVMEYVAANRGVSLLGNYAVDGFKDERVVALPLIENPVLTLSIVFPAEYLPETYERLIKFLKNPIQSPNMDTTI